MSNKKTLFPKLRLFASSLAVGLALFAPAKADDRHSLPGGSAYASPTLDWSNATHAPGYCQVSVPITSTTLATMLAAGSGGSCSAPSWATWAYFRPAAAGTGVIRCAADGTTLTTAVGFPLDGLTDFPLPGGVQNGAAFSTLNCISTTGSPSIMDIWWMG